MSSQPYDPSQQQQIYAYDYQQQHPQPSSYDPYQTQQYYHNQTHPPPPPSSSSSSYPPYYTPAYTSGPNTNCNNNNYGVEDSSIHPPGVPITESNGSISSNDVQNQHNSYYYYYPNAGIADMSINNQPHVQNPQIIQASNAVANGTGHNYSTATGQAHYSTAHGQTYAAPLAQGGTPIPAPPSQSIQPSYGPTPSILNKRIKAKGRKMKSQQPPQSARCELCKVDCNSLEIFEQHKNGKKHQKNLKAHKGLQTLNNVMVVGQTAPENEPEMSSQFENVEGSNDKHLPIQTSSCVAANTGEQKAVQADGTEESTARKRKKKSVEAKRKMKNGKGVKWIRSDDGSKIPVEAPKPQVIPLICELCNVTCESPVVFHAHLTGKKHLANLKRFQSEQEILGQAAVQALYPALQALYPALQALCQGDMTSLISLLQQQGFLGVQPQPVPSNYFQGQVSEVPPATADLTEIPHSAAFPEQQPDIPPTGLETAGASQVVAVTEGKSNEQPSPAPEVTKDAESEILEGK